MSIVELCLSAMHSDIAQNGINLDVQAAQQNIVQIKQYFNSNISPIESEMALVSLFRDSKGIIDYAKVIINLDLTNNKIITDILFLFLQLIESFPMSIVCYIRTIIDLCLLCNFNTRKNAVIKIKIYQVYEKILGFNNISEQIEINKIIQNLNNEISLGDKTSSTVRQHLYNLFGVIAYHHPLYLKNYEEKLMNLFCYELQNQIDLWRKNERTFLPAVIVGCLNGLTKFLTNFGDYIETRDYRFRLYDIIKKLIGTVEENKRHVINRSGLNLFQKHIQLFSKLLFSDLTEITWFQKTLWDWCSLTNVENKKIGLYSFEMFYKGATIELSRHLETNESNIKKKKQEIVNNMIIFLKSKMYDDKLNFQEHAVVIKSIGWLSEPCDNLLGQDTLIELFMILMLQAEEKYLSCMYKKKISDQNAANYLISLSLVLRNLKSLNYDQVSFIQRLSIFCFNEFISLQSKLEWQDNVTDAIIISIYCLALSHENIFNTYLKQLFFMGLITSCSHRATIDADIIEEYTGHILIKSSNYVSLWISLLKAHQCHSFDMYLSIPITLRGSLAKSLMSNFMFSILKIIKTLDLSTYKSTNEFETNIAVKPPDFTVLINLVEIYQEILNNLELDNEISSVWLPDTLNIIINHSIEFPTVSSLYKILTIIFQELDLFTFLEKNDFIKNKIVEYINCVMKYVYTYKGELQISCLQMFISLPSNIVNELLNIQILDIIKVALTVGSTFLPLVKNTLNVFQRWHQNLSKNEIDQLLKQIMPHLDLLLRTKGFDDEIELDDSILNQVNVHNCRKRTLVKKNKLIIKSETDLEIVQIQILEFLAQLNINSCLGILVNTNENISFPINVINYKLSFSDCKINISFDQLLPRILELCQYCSNRQIRFIACEIFHTYIILYLGNNLTLERAKPSEMEMITKIIIPVIIKLACDMDNLVQQLFEPLAIGIVHHFASGIKYGSIYTPIVLNILMDSVSDNNNEMVRHFSAQCITEFLSWSLKEHYCDNFKKSINSRTILQKIIQFCEHSDLNKQLGAVIVFNSCYFILQEDETIVNDLWIQLLYYFVLLLDEKKSIYFEEHILKAIDLLQKVFLEKSNLFNQISVSRVIPKSFHGAILFNVIEWILKYIGSPIANCRLKCFDLANSLARNVEGHNSLKSIFNSFIILHGEEKLINCIERDLNSLKLRNMNSSFDETCLNFASVTKVLTEWLDQLTASLDCYISLLKESIVDIYLFKSPYSSLFQSIHCFLFQIEEFSLIQWLNNINIHFKEKNKDLIVESRSFNILKNRIIANLFQLLNMIDNNLILLTNKDMEKINDLALKYIFEYDIVSFIEKLNSHKILAVQYIKNVCSLSSFNNKLKQYLIERWSKTVSNFFILSEYTEQINFIHGNQLLLEYNIFSSIELENIVNRTNILKVILKYVNNNGIIANFEYLKLLFLKTLLDFVLSLDNEINEVLSIITDTTDIIDTSLNKKFKFGQYFFKLFRKSITQHLLKFTDIFVKKLFTKNLLNDEILNIILEIFKELKYKKINNQSQLLVEEIMNNKTFWKQLQYQYSWNEMFEFVELTSYIVDNFRNQKFYFLQKWICENLVDDNLNIYHKCRLLGLLPKLVSSQNDEEPFDNNVRKCLNDFRDKYFSGGSSKLKPRSIDYTNLVTAFQKILISMELSSSYLLFKVIVEWCIKDPDHVCIESVEKSLSIFLKRLSNATQYSCCQFVYQKFQNEMISEDRRVMIINVFLVPIISYCKKSVVVEIYTNIIDFILKIVNENLLANDCGKARHLLISKIACFKLIEEIFRFFSTTEINNNIIPFTSFGDQSKNLITHLRTSAVKVRYSNVDYSKGSKEIQKLFRLLHCHSFNTLLTIISNTEDEVHKYTIFLFNERPPKLYIWRNLVDCNKRYDFPIDFETIPLRKKKLVNIRNKINQNIPKVYIDLCSHLKNTLVEDLESYDYNNALLRSNYVEDSSSSNSLHQMVSVELELDDFNNHECMVHLCAVVKYLTSKNIIISQPYIDMPDWMTNLKSAFCDESSNTINSKIFILKLIVNCETDFKPFAKFWLCSLMKFILNKHLGNNLNYFIIDVVSMLVSWHDITIPSTEEEKYLANRLFCFLLSISQSEIRNVFKHNMEFIKLIVENWKCSLKINSDIFLTLLKSNQSNCKLLECNLHLIGIVTTNGILPFDEHNKKNFLYLLLESLKSINQVIYVLSAELIGMLLKLFFEESMNETELLKSVLSILQFSENMDITKVLCCLYHINKHYSKILDSYEDDLFNIFKKLQGIHRTQCLEMFLSRLFIIDNTYEKISKLYGFFNILKDNGTDDQLICLKICLQLLPSLHEKDVLTIIKIIAEISYLHNNDHRKLVYDIMSNTYKIYLENNTEMSKQIQEECKKVLLKGLMDKNYELRQNIFRFWTNNKRLPHKCVDRLLILLDQLYSPDIETHFLGNLVGVLLESSCTAVDYDQKIFQYPLQACEFKDYKLTTSWRSKHIATVCTYADTIASQFNRSNTFQYSASNLNQKYQLKTTMAQLQRTLIQSQITDHNISTIEPYSNLLMNETNIFTLNPLNQHSKNQNSDSNLTSELNLIQKRKIRLLRSKSMQKKKNCDKKHTA